MAEPNYPITRTVAEMARKALRERGIAGLEVVINHDHDGEDGFDDAFDDDVSFVGPDSKAKAVSIQSGPYGCSANVDHFDANGDLEAVTVGTLREAGDLDEVVHEAVNKLAAELAEDSPTFPEP